EYLHPIRPLERIRQRVDASETDGGRYELEATVKLHGVVTDIAGSGTGTLAAFIDALGSVGFDLRVLDYRGHIVHDGAADTVTSSSQPSYVAYVEMRVGGTDGHRTNWGVGMAESATTASLRAVVSAVNRANTREQSRIAL
ncbi:alpha-isopropylmalate synthase regulatory domain-containing protein, partial [Williamsia sp.]|uniref:alpha-isopropylmalate synthase regulatory domain-containing protein n=1 Tax=Williamsia sp. TaxID=1872085 RepID=UPI001A1FD80F